MDTINLSFMKRYLQAGAIVFFFALGAHLIRQPDTSIVLYRNVIGTNGMDAALVAEAPYGIEDVVEVENSALQGLTASSALIKTSLGNRVFYELNSDQHWPLASLTKLMNAVVALENLPQSELRDNLLRRMMVISDNTAADSLAETLGTEQYVALMNTKAQSLNMGQTGFSDPSGLSYLNQSTVLDIDKLVTYILIRHPEIFTWSRATTVRMGNIDRANINEFAGRPDFLGGKTGFTDEASGNLVTIFNTTSGPLTIITLGSRAREDRFIETNILFEWATRHFKL